MCPQNDELISNMVDLLRGPTDLRLAALLVLSCRCFSISPSGVVKVFAIGNTARVVSLVWNDGRASSSERLLCRRSG
jgi:hypothetical protein